MKVFYFINGSSRETNKSQINTMMKQRWGFDRNVLRPTPGDPWGVEQPNETLAQKKTNSWTPVGQVTDKKARAQKHLHKRIDQIGEYFKRQLEDLRHVLARNSECVCLTSLHVTETACEALQYLFQNDIKSWKSVSLVSYYMFAQYILVSIFFKLQNREKVSCLRIFWYSLVQKRNHFTC